jgi:hypothetical protein
VGEVSNVANTPFTDGPAVLLGDRGTFGGIGQVSIYSISQFGSGKKALEAILFQNRFWCRRVWSWPAGLCEYRDGRKKGCDY